MSRRAFMAPADDQRCEWDITLRADGSGARCMRRATVGNLCAQHAKMDERMRASMVECCGGSDNFPPEHCMDCHTRDAAGVSAACDAALQKGNADVAMSSAKGPQA